MPTPASTSAATSGRLGLRLDPYAGFGFVVEIEGLIVGGFTEITGLQIETTVETYREGGLNDYAHKLAGPTRYPANLILKSGLTDLETMWGWYDEVRQGRIARRNGTIYLLDRRRLPAMWWDFVGAYPVRWSGPELRAESNTIAAEAIELVHRGLSKPSGSSQMSASRLGAGTAAAGG